MSRLKDRAIVALITMMVAVGVVVLVAHLRTGLQVCRLPDGSTLLLNRVSVGESVDFTHGRYLERLLGNWIPAPGFKILSFHLSRPLHCRFSSPPGETQMVAELKVAGTNARGNALVAPAFYRQFRWVIRGESGIEYAGEFLPGRPFGGLGSFQSIADGYFGYVVANRYPRLSPWLWLRVERRESPDRAGPWQKVAEFMIRNPARSTPQPWTADPPNTSKTVDGLDISLGQVTVLTQPFSPRDIWNHVVTAPFEVRRDGLLLTNWCASRVRPRDASGNWDYLLAGFRSLDPGCVWKLDADFEPQSDFQPTNLLTVNIPLVSVPLTVNLMGVPVTISWDGSFVDAAIPTNRADLALRFVCLTDVHGRKLPDEFVGSWGQHSFRMGDFMPRGARGLNVASPGPATVTIAVVPCVHATFYAQPRLLATPSAQ
jgi:hypothetical protein